MNSVEANEFTDSNPNENAHGRSDEENVLANAIALLTLGQLEAAEAKALEALTDQDSFGIQRTLGIIARHRQRPREAIQHFKNARRFAPLDAWDLFEIGRELAGLGEYAEATAALAAIPDRAAALHQIGLIERGRKDHETALHHFTAARDIAPRNPWYHLDVVAELRVLGRLDEAESVCWDVVTLHPGLAVAHRVLGLILRERKDHLGAIACFQKAKHHSPLEAWNLLDIGNEYRTLERYDEALAEYHAALALKDDFAEAHHQIGLIERGRKNHETALRHLTAARDNAPQNPWYHLEVVAELRALGRPDEAESVCREVVGRYPDFAPADRVLGSILRERKDHLGAIACFERVRQHSPVDAWNLLEIANEYRALQRYDEALAQYRKAIAVTPDFAEAHHQIGLIERGRRNHETALHHFTVARDNAPLNPWYHLAVVAELKVLGRLDEAESACRQLIDAQPDFGPAHRTLGFMARERKDHFAAIACFEKAKQCDPNDAWATFDIAHEYQMLERFDEAVTYYAEALAVTPGLFEARRQIGLIERGRGNERAAIGNFNIGLHFAEIAAAGGAVRAAIASVELLIQLDRTADAETRLAALDKRDLDPELLPETHTLAATISNKKGDFASEIFHRREAARLRRNHVWSWLGLVERQIALSMLVPAFADIEEALTNLPDEPNLLAERARTLRLSGRADDAVRQLKSILVTEDMSSSARIRLANEYRNLGLWDEARALAEDVIRAEPHFTPAHVSLAFTVMDHDGPIAGLEQFKLELERSPDNLEAAFHVSRLTREIGNARGALDFLEARGTDVKSPLRIFEEMILCLCLCDEFRRARELVAEREELAIQGDDLLDLSIEIEINAGNSKKLAELVAVANDLGMKSPRILSRIARAAYVLGDLETVISANESWIEQDSTRELHGGIAIAESKFRLGEQDLATNILDSLAEKFGDSRELCASRARLLREAGKLRQAESCLVAGLERFPNDPSLWEQYVRHCIQTGQFETAQDLLDSPMDRNYAASAQRALFEIELGLEKRNLDDVSVKIAAFDPRYPFHRAVYHGLSARYCLNAVDLESMRMHLASEIDIWKFDRKLRRQSRNVSQSLLGQLLDEYELDADSVRTLVDIKRMPLDARGDRYLELIRQNPDSTAAAITTLIHLRHTGFFSFPDETGGSDIPTRIAQFWDTNRVPPDVAKYMESWRSNNPDWDYELFDTTTAGDFIRSTCSSDVHSAYWRCNDATRKADLFRLAWLSSRGGVYADVDDVCTGSIRNVLKPGATFIAHQEDIGSIGNNFLGAAKGHPIIAKALEQVTTSVLRGDSEMVWLATGPGMLSRVFTAWLAAAPDGPQALRDEVVILDRGELTRVCAPHCQAAYKLTPLHWSKGMFG